MVGTHAHGDEPLDNNADASPEGGEAAPEKAAAAAPEGEAAAAPEKEAAAEENQKSPEASEKRKEIAKDLEGRPDIIDPEVEASKKLSSDS
jgi:hypothetical protein